jgi:hypothetical protein
MNAKRWLSVFGLAAILFHATGASADDEGRPFDNGSIRGSYGFSFSGSVLVPIPGQSTPIQLLVAAVGRFVSDGNGSITDGSRTISINGSAVLQIFECTYQVQSDGTGTASCPVFETGTIETFSVVLNTHAKELNFVATSPGTIVVGTAKKQ